MQALGPHIPAYAYQWCSPTFFERAFKFCVVRNPWDRLVSAFHFLKRSQWPDDRVWSERRLGQYPAFEAFLEALQQPLFRNVVLSQVHFHPQHSFITDTRDRIIVDRVIYFDNLTSGLQGVRERLGLGAARIDPPSRNTSDHLDYRGYYDDRGRELVGRMYRRDIELLGFDFDGRATR